MDLQCATEEGDPAVDRYVNKDVFNLLGLRRHVGPTESKKERERLQARKSALEAN